MMKPGNDVFEARVAERNERAKKLYRYINDVARRIDDTTSSCQSIEDYFSTKLELQRQKLRDNCEKLLFLDPLHHGKKSLELLWRKVYYDPVSAAKKLRKPDEDYEPILFTHIICGIGHFHSIITRVQTEMNIKIKELDYNLFYKDEESKDMIADLSEEEMQFGRGALHSCLIYLGDLSRYQFEMFHTFDSAIAARYYLQAAHIDMSLGMPYNQLGNLYLDKNYNLDSVCYYIHCLNCVSPFEGATGNLLKIFEKYDQIFDASNEAGNISQVEHIQNTISNFLSLIDIWYFEKNDENVPLLCNTIVHQLKSGMQFKKPLLPDINKNYSERNQLLDEETITPSYLNNDILHKIVQICLFTMTKLSETDETKAFPCKALTLALLSQILQKQLQQLKDIGLKSPAYKYKNYKGSATSVIICETNIKGMDVNNDLVINSEAPEVPAVNGNNDNKESHKQEDNIMSDADSKKITNGDPKVTNKKVSTKRRRRRRNVSSESSDMSDVDTESSEVDSDTSNSEEEDEENDISDSTLTSDDESKNFDDLHSDNENKKVNGNTELPKTDVKDTGTLPNEKNNDAKKDINKTNIPSIINDKDTNFQNANFVPELNDQEILNFLSGDNFLPTIKLLADWIITEKDLILSCGESGESLFQCVVDILNIFQHYFTLENNESLKTENIKILNYAKTVARNLKLEYKTIPLPEDINLRGTNICKFDKDAAEWQILDKYQPSVYEENTIRILCFIDFGNQIASIVPRIRFNRTMKIFYLKKIPTPKLNMKHGHKRSREWHNSKIKNMGGSEGGLLRRLGRLWLAARVSELERSAPPACASLASLASPALLALDASALSMHLRRVKLLLKTNNFILLIPSIVLQELDELKKENSSARDAIRWLEMQLKSGSRFLKAQRPGQSKPLPLLKYPRKAPPYVHNFIQILEFCHHFIVDDKSNQVGSTDAEGSLNGKSPPLLILLVGDELGNEQQFKEFSLLGAAQASGITVEYIADFYAKWRQTVHKSSKKR